jgi:hypothetical protein
LESVLGVDVPDAAGVLDAVELPDVLVFGADLSDPAADDEPPA